MKAKLPKRRKCKSCLKHFAPKYMVQPCCDLQCMFDLDAKKRALKPVVIKPKKSSRGLKGKAVSTEDREYHDKLCALGCIACRKDGCVNTYCVPHHIDGRTKPGAHRLVIPLCYPHHQGDGSIVPAIHHNKARFESKYGKQLELLAECNALLQQQGEAA